MSLDPIPESLNIPLSSLVRLAIEHWRLRDALTRPPAGPAVGDRVDAGGGGGSGSGAVRHALRRTAEILAACGLEVQSMDGRAYDPGLAARVVDTTDDPRLPAGAALIIETVSPLVLWRGQVVRPADVVTVRGTGPG